MSSTKQIGEAANEARSETVRAVERAISDLRRGEPVVVVGAEPRPILVLAAETTTGVGLERLSALAALDTDVPVAPSLALTARRAAALGLCEAHRPGVMTVPFGPDTDAETIRALADPTHVSPDLAPERTIAVMAAGSAAAVSVELARLACLLPAAVLVSLPVPPEDVGGWAQARELLVVSRGDIVTYHERVAHTLRRVADAELPLSGAENTRIIAFRPNDGGAEHLAVVIGQPTRRRPVLTRVHSQCFTGDLLGSLRCDCGEQLRGAIEAIAAAGGGVLLYLSQEGRGIGLINKLRAYALQDQGLDTVDANEQLGFEEDERLYLAAGEILRQLGYQRVRLMTNNPSKVEALANCGVDVVERVPHVFKANRHNAEYLATKARRSGHIM